MNREQRNTITSRMARAGIPFAVAQTNSTTRSAVEIRHIVIQLLYFFEGLTQVEIADLLHTTQASISRSMKTFAEKRKQHKFSDNFLKNYDDYRLKYKSVLSHEKQNANITD